ncbi:MAG: type II toxin-antitoxin system VapC family toxin [Gammaproteobacteria bacterium]|nr:type II toxin-antitoxin system VapC family toxin [Gammaproteobacteria bacterium]
MAEATSIPSYLTAHASNDIRVVANQNTTIEWWENCRSNFDLFISEFVIAEAGLGDPKAVQKRLEVIAELPELEITENVHVLATTLITEGPIPAKAKRRRGQVSHCTPHASFPIRNGSR